MSRLILLPSFLALFALSACGMFEGAKDKDGVKTVRSQRSEVAYDRQPELLPIVKSNQEGEEEQMIKEEEKVDEDFLLQVPPEFSILSFASMRLEGTEFKLGEVLQKNEAYTRYAISYLSNGLKISGIMNIPLRRGSVQAPGEGSFPLLILNHGFINPSVYTNGRGLKREQDYLARQGFAVLHSDYRGHASSDPSPNPHIFDAALEYSMDVVNAILAVQSAELENVDASRVGMLGHSLGGAIALNIATAYPDLVDAFVLYASVNSDAWINFTHWEDMRNEGDKTREVYQTPTENPDFWNNISSKNFLERISAPILVFHGDKDEDVPKEWSDSLVERLRELKKEVTYIEYEDEKHEFINQFSDFMQKSVAFFDRELRKEEKEEKEEREENAEVVAENLRIPWSIAFLPSGDMLVTERTGTLLRFSAGDQKRYPIEGVKHVGEGGLLGMALHPDFERTRWLYLYLTTQTDAGIMNRIERYRFENDVLSERTEILSGIPGAKYHDGGFLGFSPDGYLFVTTGDSGKSALAQDTQSLAGKILRLRDDGSVPEDNPFGNPVYSYGHRNPQGLAWDNEGRLWSTEHGRSGIRSGLDELNLIKKGGNYGWPVIQGDETLGGMVAPVLHSGPRTTWAPASAAYFDGSIFFGGLKGEALYEVNISEGNLRTHFLNKYGRIRAVKIGPDGFLYISTSNTDGRGDPVPSDDRILRADPRQFGGTI